MPKICSGLHKQKFESIRGTISKIFGETHIKIVVQIKLKEVILGDKSSILAQVDENECISYQTVYSDDENELNSVALRGNSINTGKYQIVMSVQEDSTKIKITIFLRNLKQRFIVKIN